LSSTTSNTRLPSTSIDMDHNDVVAGNSYVGEAACIGHSLTSVLVLYGTMNRNYWRRCYGISID
jgi:hypothetical protein